jgi:hypothetical protein
MKEESGVPREKLQYLVELIKLEALFSHVTEISITKVRNLVPRLLPSGSCSRDLLKSIIIIN